MQNEVEEEIKISLEYNEALLAKVKLELHLAEKRYKEVKNRVKTLQRQQACKHVWINKRAGGLYCAKCSRSYKE